MNLLEIDLDKLISILGTDPSLGLTGEQVLRNRREFGENVQTEKPRSVSHLARKIFGDVMMIIFLVTGLFDYLSAHNPASLICILFTAALYITLVFGSFLYTRSVALRVDKLSRSRVRVRRNGRVVSVRREEIVPGDVLLIDRGEVMPCDGVILSADSLCVLESKGKGLRRPVVKSGHEEVRSNESRSYFECVLFAGDVILQGSARVFVCNTGKDVFDRGNAAVSRQNGTVPRIYTLAMGMKREILLLWVLICFIIFAWGVFRGQEVFSIFYYSVAMVVAAFPSSIEFFCDLATAYMTDRLLREGAILRNPGAIDRLCDVKAVFVDSADYLFYAKPLATLYCVGDKEYDFRADHVPAKPLLEDLLLAEMTPVYWNDPRHGEEGKSEKAILAAAARCGLQKRKLDRTYLYVSRIDPAAGRDFACALVLRDGAYRLIARGEPERILLLCSAYRSGPEDLPLTEGVARAIRNSFRRVAASCERIVAVAELTLSSPPDGDVVSHCRHMTYMGVFGLSTPVSAAAANEVNICEKNGIRTYLLTQDYPETVESLAKSTSIIREADKQNALRYDSYLRMDRGVFVADMARYKAYSQFPAEERQAIVSYHKTNGEVTMSLTDGMGDVLPQTESDVSLACAAEKIAAVRLNADVLVREKKFELAPMCIRWARLLVRSIVHILQFILLLQVALCFSVFLSLTLNSQTVYPLPAMIFVGLGAALPAAFNIYHRKPGPAMVKRPVVLKNRICSLQELIIMPAIAGLVCAIGVTLSRQITLFSSGNTDAASSAGLLTMAFSAWFASLSIKSESAIIYNLRGIGRTGLVTFLVTLAVTGVTVFSPFAALYNPSYASLGAGLTLATGSIALLLSLLPMLSMELMKYLRRDDVFKLPVHRKTGAKQKKRRALFFRKKKAIGTNEELTDNTETVETPDSEKAEDGGAAEPEEAEEEVDIPDLAAIIGKAAAKDAAVPVEGVNSPEEDGEEDSTDPDEPDEGIEEISENEDPPDPERRES